MKLTAPAPDVQYVTLGIDKGMFAIPVQLVQEILDLRDITRIPDAPRHILGLIDVRGRSVAVMDLRIRLGLASADSSEHTRILVLDIPSGAKRSVVALLVDRVFEVTALDGQGVEPPPDIGTEWRYDSVRGIGRRGDDFVILLDIGRLFGDVA